jgi:hypothetical protein
MVNQMTQAKTQAAPDMPVTARNAAKTDAQRAASTIRLLKAQYGSFAAVSQELANRGHATNRGLLCAVMNGKRPPSKELLIALGLRKPPRVLSEAEREARKKTREITKALWLIYSRAETGCTVSIKHNPSGDWWIVKITSRVNEIGYTGIDRTLSAAVDEATRNYSNK